MAKELYIEGSSVTPVIKALSNEVRLKILNLLSDGDLNIQTLAQELKLSKTAVLAHVNILEQTGFIESQYLPGSVGNQRICHKMYDRLIFDFEPGKITMDELVYYETEIPIGNYFDFEAWPPCGLAKSSKIINKWDDPAVFCDVRRVEAALVWTAFGFVEYKIPVDPLFIDKKVTEVKISLEISAHHMVRDHKALRLPPYMTRDKITEDITDLTLWINGHEVGTQTLRMGNDPQKANYTPSWWRSLPLHGQLVDIKINREGCFLQEEPASAHTIESLFDDSGFLRLRLSVKEDAAHSNGFMIFGKGFGRYNQDIIVKSYIE